MLKRVLVDYIRSFRWKKFVRMNRETSSFFLWYSIVYLLIVFPLLNEEIGDSMYSRVGYYLWAVTFLIGMLGLELFPLRLPKIMFLCPMNQRERKQYISNVFWVRIFVPIFLEGMVCIVLVVCQIFNTIYVTLHLFASIAMLIFISLLLMNGKPLMCKKIEDNVKMVGGILGFGVSIAIIVLLGMMTEELMGEISSIHYGLAIGIIVLACIDLLLLRKLSERIEEIVAYEESYAIVKLK